MRLQIKNNIFFFNDTATTEIYTLSLHDALPIAEIRQHRRRRTDRLLAWQCFLAQDRKSTRLNSSHEWISYAVFCLIKKIQSMASCMSWKVRQLSYPRSEEHTSD